MRLKVFLLAKKPKVFSFEHLKVVDRDFMPAIRTYQKASVCKGGVQNYINNTKASKELDRKIAA